VVPRREHRARQARQRIASRQKPARKFIVVLTHPTETIKLSSGVTVSHLFRSVTTACIAIISSIPLPFCTLCPWPGCRAPRPRLPASLSGHVRAPGRVKRQHSKVAVPSLRGGGINAATRSRNSLALSRSSVYFASLSIFNASSTCLVACICELNT